MPGYVAIEPIDELARRLAIAPEQVVKLDGNENPYGPSPKALEALAACRYYHIYPDPLQREAREALSAYLGVGAEHIILGTGSDEVMDMILRAFVRPGDGVINCPPTFGMYPFLTRVVGGRVLDVPRRDDFSLDLPAIEAAAKQAKVIFIASPNNPSGNVLSRRGARRPACPGAGRRRRRGVRGVRRGKPRRPRAVAGQPVRPAHVQQVGRACRPPRRLRRFSRLPSPRP